MEGLRTGLRVVAACRRACLAFDVEMGVEMFQTQQRTPEPRSRVALSVAKRTSAATAAVADPSENVKKACDFLEVMVKTWDDRRVYLL